jgi:putative phosphoribosyl transferase
VPDSYIEEEKKHQLEEIERRRTLYLRGRAPVPIAGRTAIVVDDGIATGATMRAALRAVRAAKPKCMVMAVPVAPPETIDEMRDEADDVVCLEMPVPFGAVGVFYADFRQTEDEEVSDLLDRAAQLSAG